MDAFLRLLACTIRIGEQRFYLLLEEWIASAGAFYKRCATKRIITFDGIGQDRLYLLPAFWSHLDGTRVEGPPLFSVATKSEVPQDA